MTAITRLTLAEFLRLPETKPASEFEDGEVCRKTMPTVWHSIIQRLLSFVFTLYLRDHPVGEAGPELRCTFGSPGRERSYVPDYVFSIGGPPAFGVVNGTYNAAPDLAVEILSPSDGMTRVRRKLRFYLENGVRLVWLIDPEDRTVTVMTSTSASTTLFEDDELDAGDVLPGFHVPVGEILPPVMTPAG